MKIKIGLVLLIGLLVLVACAPAAPNALASQTVTFDQQYVAHSSSTYVSDEVIGKDVVVYLKSEDKGYNFWLPSFYQYKKWYTVDNGRAIQHNNELAIPWDEIVPLETTVNFPFGGVATPMPSATPIPAGTIVFHDRYKADDGTTVYIDGIYNHLTYSYGYGLPEQGGKFNEWYTVDDGKAVKHTGEIALQPDGYEHSDTGWSFTIK